MNKNRLLISRYLDGELEVDEVVQLAEALQADFAAIEWLVINSFVHSQLLNWLDQEREHEHTVAAPFGRRATPPGTVGSSAIKPLRETPDKSPSFYRMQHPSAVRFMPLLRSWGAIAATVIVAASISAVGYIFASRPVFVGQLTEATGCQWSESQEEMGAGTFLQQGQDLRLDKGSAVITFASGAKLYMEGPSSLRLVSANELQLISGQIAAKVPRQAIGFTITSSLGRVVDLGTAFTLSLIAEKSFELDVFEGLVELQLDERFGPAAHQPVRVAEVHAVSFNVNFGDVAPIEFQEGKKMPF